MTYNLRDQHDPKNMYKRCPNIECRLVWVKVEGCPNVTCGNVPDKYYD